MEMGSSLNYWGIFPEPLCRAGPPRKELHLPKSRNCWIRKLPLWRVTKMAWKEMKKYRIKKKKSTWPRWWDLQLWGPTCENVKTTYFSGVLCHSFYLLNLVLPNFLRILPCLSVCFSLSVTLLSPLTSILCLVQAPAFAWSCPLYWSLSLSLWYPTPVWSTIHL